MTTDHSNENAEFGIRNSECDSSRAPRGIRTQRGPIPHSAFRIPHFLVLLLVSASAPAASESLLYPDTRKVLDVRANERNPFAQQITDSPGPTQEGVSEDARLRRILRAMKIGGVSGTPGHRQLLLGSLILKPGVVLPPLISNQAEVLRVVSVDDSSITLEFVEKDPASDARKILLTFGIKPEVRQFMYGEAVEAVTKAGVTAQPELKQAPYPDDPLARAILTNIQEAEQTRSSDKLMGVLPNAEDKKNRK
ncbi:MAG: hypothetical protein D4R65_00915 [Verrucomicrobiaceae bacterium]|nr:MAG: hypothetical protein D4R65_00915 [Verrucomicrobiaceae bacterium]